MNMRNLPNITITKEQFQYIKATTLFDYGSESVLYKIPSIFGTKTVAKIFFGLNDTVIQNKFEKLKRLYQIETLPKINEVQILASISCNKKVIGYLMNCSSFQEIAKVPRKRSETLQYLILARQKLKQLEQLGILYGDISSSNLLVGENNVCFCDLDNVAYQNFSMDNYTNVLIEFIKNYGCFNEKAISYMFNILTIKELCFIEENRLVEEYLETEQIPRELASRPYRYIRNQMRFITPQYEGFYFIDHVKKKK